MSTSIGHQLREARQAKNLSLEQVSRITHIRPQILEALEAGNLEALPSITQARGFLRAYTLHLGLDPDVLVARLGVDESSEPVQSPAETRFTETIAGNIYEEIGDRLRTQRETLGVTIDEVENQTRLRRHHIEALERGDLEQLPSPVQGRGMLKNYATFLGLHPEPLLLKFAEGLQAQLDDRRSFTPRRNERSQRSFFSRFISGDLLFGGIILLALIVFVIWSVGRVSNVQDSFEGQATAPAIVDMLDPLPTETLIPTLVPTLDPLVDTPTPDFSGAEGNPTAVPTEPIINNDPVQVYIVVMERAWIRVTVDGQIELEGRVIPGSAYPFSGRQLIIVLTSSGSALEIFYNQEDQGPMGLFGQIVERIYTPNEILVPTPVESPTPLPTITPTESLEESPTPTP